MGMGDGLAILPESAQTRPNCENAPLISDSDYVATRWYRAPELLVKELHYDQGVDIWAVGCLLPEMLSGDALFPGESGLHFRRRFYSSCSFMQQISTNCNSSFPSAARCQNNSSRPFDKSQISIRRACQNPNAVRNIFFSKYTKAFKRDDSPCKKCLMPKFSILISAAGE